MEIPYSSFLRVGSQLARESEMDPIINIFLDNGYTLQFTRDILEPLTSEQINYFLENLPRLQKKLETSNEDIIHFLSSAKVGVKQSKTPPISRFPEGPIDTAFISSEPKFIPNTRKQEKIDRLNMISHENITLRCLQQQHKGRVTEPFVDLSRLRELTPVEIEKAHIALFDFLQAVISNKIVLPRELDESGHWTLPILQGTDATSKKLLRRIFLPEDFLRWINESKTPNEKVQKIAHRISCFSDYFDKRLKKEPSKQRINRGGKETRKIN